MSLTVDKDTLIKYTDEAGVFSVTLPGEIKYIDRRAFDGCSLVKNVTGMNVVSIGKVWGNHEIKGARPDLCLVCPKVEIDHEPAYTFKMALCLGFLKYKNLYNETRPAYTDYAAVQKKWLLKSLIRADSDEMLLKALEFYLDINAITAQETEEFLSFASQNEKTLSCAVLINFRHGFFAKNGGDVFDEFAL